MVDSIDVLDMLGINTASISKFLTNEAEIKCLSAGDFTDEKMKQVFRAGIEADFEEAQNEETGTRALIKKKDGSGTLWKLTNVRINRKALLDALLGIVDFVISLSPLTLIRILKNIFDALQISLSSDEVFVFWNIYLSSKRVLVTDENLFEIMTTAIESDSYDDLSKKEIKRIIDQLIKTRMIKRDDKSYTVTEKMVVHWL